MTPGELIEGDDLLLMKMPPHAVAVITRAHQGAKYEQIAAACGIPLGTVKSRLHRARQRLASLRAAAEPQS